MREGIGFTQHQVYFTLWQDKWKATTNHAWHQQSGVFWLLGRACSIPKSLHAQDMCDHRDRAELLEAISLGFEYLANCTTVWYCSISSISFIFYLKKHLDDNVQVLGQVHTPQAAYHLSWIGYGYSSSVSVTRKI